MSPVASRFSNLKLLIHQNKCGNKIEFNIFNWALDCQVSIFYRIKFYHFLKAKPVMKREIQDLIMPGR